MNTQAGEFNARCGGLLAGRRRLLGNIPNIQHAAVDLFGNCALLFSRCSDLVIHRLDGRYCLGDVTDGDARITRQFDAVGGQRLAVVEDRRHLRGATVQSSDQCSNLFCRCLGALRQASHFVSNHRETSPGFPGARSFDRSVERQQVGLLGNRLDDVEYATNLVAFAFELVHGGFGVLHFSGKLLDLRHSPGNDAVAFTRLFRGVDRRMGSLLGVSRDFLNGCRHLMHGGRHLIRLAFLAVDTGAGLLGDCRQLLGSAGNLRHAVTQPANQLAQVGGHAQHAALQASKLILAGNRLVVGQITISHAFGQFQCFEQRTYDQAGYHPRSQDTHNQRRNQP